MPTPTSELVGNEDNLNFLKSFPAIYLIVCTHQETVTRYGTNLEKWDWTSGKQLWNSMQNIIPPTL